MHVRWSNWGVYWQSKNPRFWRLGCWRMSELHTFYFGWEGHVEAADAGGDAVFWWSGHAELHVVGDTAYEPWEKCGVRRVVVDGGLRRFDFPGAKHTGRGIFG